VKKATPQNKGEYTQKEQTITTQIIKKQNDIDKAISERFKLIGEKERILIVKLHEITSTQQKLQQRLDELKKREKQAEIERAEIKKQIETLTNLQQKLSQPITEEEKNQINEQIEKLKAEIASRSQKLEAEATANSQTCADIEKELKNSEDLRTEIEKILTQTINNKQTLGTPVQEPDYSPLTPEEKKLPICKQIEILKQKEGNIQLYYSLILYNCDIFCTFASD
jgi:chromosome segregation ATPase